MVKRLSLAVFVKLEELERPDLEPRQYHSMSLPKPMWQSQACESARLVGSHEIGGHLVLVYDWAPGEG
jgi:hypothetical protein